MGSYELAHDAVSSRIEIPARTRNITILVGGTPKTGDPIIFSEIRIKQHGYAEPGSEHG